MPRLHPRQTIVNRASADLRGRLLDWMKANTDLTYGEYFRVVGEVFAGELSSLARDLIQQERHPDDPDHPGGWE